MGTNNLRAKTELIACINRVSMTGVKSVTLKAGSRKLVKSMREESVMQAGQDWGITEMNGRYYLGNILINFIRE